VCCAAFMLTCACLTLQERRVKEKDKRMRGQSSVNHWKSEAEMVLRQQYDS